MAFTLDQLVIFAVRAKNLELLRERVSAGGNINHQDPIHGSALVAAINNNDLEAIKFLIERGVDVNADNSDWVSPLEISLHHADDEVVRLLAWSGAKLKQKSRPHWKDRLAKCLGSE